MSSDPGSPGTPFPDALSPHSEWDKEEIDQILAELDSAEEHREEIIDRISEGNDPADEDKDRLQSFEELVQKGTLAISISITLTILSVYSLQVGFTQESPPLIATSLTMMVIIGYHHWRWRRTITND